MFIGFGFKLVFIALGICLVILFVCLIIYNCIKIRLAKQCSFEKIIELPIDTNPFS